ncbi:DUF1674 domain-containing protein [Aurantimonas sp. Leaf443]|uniref:DUF1674 domain-containing protein n=1 Tax=Aurantimonas sp. Leaf443 TaxID=1736378 RepID=UPI0006FE5B04|nr:DUF1674 domain-containing protein [Aurantimonas sp. Leaf443]KQT85526.1 dihydrodipicolinate reductase [Aurantimonas sp. Leaf443]
MADAPLPAEETTSEPEAAPRALSPAAERALAEAAARRAANEAVKVDPATRPPEQGGRGGPEPVRYGDWEKNGIISDF